MFSHHVLVRSSHWKFCGVRMSYSKVTWVPVTTAWRVLGLRMEETACRFGGVAANVLND
jgi:hypothetical protein